MDRPSKQHEGTSGSFSRWTPAKRQKTRHEGAYETTESEYSYWIMKVKYLSVGCGIPLRSVPLRHIWNMHLDWLIDHLQSNESSIQLRHTIVSYCDQMKNSNTYYHSYQSLGMATRLRTFLSPPFPVCFVTVCHFNQPIRNFLISFHHYVK